ncbi:hypothetical protein Tco_0333452 [Tanacetum coccineum]
MVPFVLSWGGSISSDSFLPSILLLVVIIITVVIVVVILIVVVVVIVGVVGRMHSTRTRRHRLEYPGSTNVTISSRQLLRENTDLVVQTRDEANRPFCTIEIGKSAAIPSSNQLPVWLPES